MSVKVDLDRLASTLADYPCGYLITVSDDHRAHTVAVVARLTDGVLDVGAVGNSTRRNICGHPDATLLWPPREPGGYSLIVDGRGELTDDFLRVIPQRAVLHRPAVPGVSTTPTASGCGDDCVPL
ncbi:pyridoxamine 5'-phosphate oxidase family protein [Mycolicibacterium sp. Dal123E01]|uniref:pyridoxamine 5'-phosphate oxidase family protein n=1 Tax=Mycolicibacterium sp. Dal123E01 TaxID=3457578 RepID=UPI00403EAF32